MDELDLLKKHWQNDAEFAKVNTNEIKAMLHKSSSSIVRKIFIISIIELILGLLLNLLPTPPKLHSSYYQVIELTATCIFYVVILYFIFQFFKNYATIKNTDSTKVLLANIIKTRKNVGAYIKFNIYYFCILFLFLAIDEVLMDFLKAEKISSYLLFQEFCKILAFTIISILFIMLIKYIYRLVYVRLLHKLNINYEELESLDQK